MNGGASLARRIYSLTADSVIESVKSNSQFLLKSGYSEKEPLKLYTLKLYTTVIEKEKAKA
jgi:hypothetical protein